MDHLTASQIDTLRRRVDDLDPSRASLLRSRLAEGTYGLCSQCGDELPYVDLVNRPDRGLCGDCTDRLKATRAGRRLGVCGIKPAG